MSNQDIGIARNFIIIATLTVSYAITHKHRDSIKPHTINLNARIAEIMDVAVQTDDICAIKAIVMVATDKDFMFIMQSYYKKVKCGKI